MTAVAQYMPPPAIRRIPSSEVNRSSDAIALYSERGEKGNLAKIRSVQPPFFRLLPLLVTQSVPHGFIPQSFKLSRGRFSGKGSSSAPVSPITGLSKPP